jgi:hypothetical protein
VVLSQEGRLTTNGKTEMEVKLMSKILKWSSIALVLLFVGAQFIRPEKTNPPIVEARTIQAHAEIAPEVAAIFERACQDCHSHKTQWPWYSHVAPVSWFVIDHVNHGRKHLNFSDWMQQDCHGPMKDTSALLGDVCKEIQGGQMPLRSYTLLHPNAKLSGEDIKTICDWAEAERQRLAQTLEKESALR